MAAEEDRPFKAEYAKSSRAGCKQCKGAITKDTLRLAKMVQVAYNSLHEELETDINGVFSRLDHYCTSSLSQSFLNVQCFFYGV